MSAARAEEIVAGGSSRPEPGSTEVSIIIPCRDEERFIEACLDSVLAQDFPREKMEILAVDGMSDDATRRLIAAYAERHDCIRLIDNPSRIVSAALNEGIRQAAGDVIIRMDAHAEYPRDYVSKCVHYLNEYGVDNVGGVLETVPGSAGIMPEAIALAFSSNFGVGNSYFRTGVDSPRQVDTVPFGCYRKDVFGRIGLFDEDLVRNQDDELNLRLIRSGGRIMLFPDVSCRYHARESLGKTWRMFYQYGYLKPLVALKVGGVMTRRQLIPSALVVALAATGLASVFFTPAIWAFAAVGLSYLGMAVGKSLSLARRRPACAVVLPAVFATMHFAYGCGYLRGVFDFVLRKRHAAAPRRDLPMTR